MIQKRRFLGGVGGWQGVHMRLSIMVLSPLGAVTALCALRAILILLSDDAYNLIFFVSDFKLRLSNRSVFFRGGRGGLFGVM